MRNINRSILRLNQMLVLLIVLASLGSAEKVIVGVSPSKIAFKDVLRGGYSERSIVISADSVRDVGVNLASQGGIANWLNFSFKEFNVSKTSPASVVISVNPPSDVPNGNYSGFVRISTSAFGEGVSGSAVSVVKSTLDLLVEAEVTDKEIIQCAISKVVVDSVEKGEPVEFRLEFENRGNVRLKPNIQIDLWDVERTEIAGQKGFSEKEVLPSKSQEIVLEMDTGGFELGQYWAEILARDCYQSTTLTFDILEEGSLRADGTLLGIVTRKNTSIGNTIPITVKFKNTGEKSVDALFRGKVSLDGEITTFLESEEISVPVSQIGEFDLYYTPKKAGKHIISGYVSYSKKRTFEASTFINVFSKEKNYLDYLIPLAYLALVSIIIFAVYRIRKERRIYIDKLSRLRR